jgi:demethylmenaquinone methyltransferase/2-methoxy-6-polyprenyl-1,4-benzoquinol methylase
MNRFQEPEARQAIVDLQLPAGSRGLDVGCGVGLYALWLAEAIGRQGHVVAIEPNAERVAAAQRRVGERLEAGRIAFRQGDGTALDMADRSFDWVWCGDVLHHIDAPVMALKEFIRVLRPGGRVIIKESQVAPALFLPGYPELERQLQRAEMQFNRHEAGAHSFQERRQRTPESMRQAGLNVISLRTYIVQRQAPLDATARSYIQHTVFERNWGPRLRGLLDTQDWQQRSALCEADAPQYILASLDYYCMYPFSVFTAQISG